MATESKHLVGRRSLFRWRFDWGGEMEVFFVQDKEGHSDLDISTNRPVGDFTDREIALIVRFTIASLETQGLRLGHPQSRRS